MTSELDYKLLLRKKQSFTCVLSITKSPYQAEHLIGTLNKNLLKINKSVGCQSEWQLLPFPLYFSHLHYYLPI